MKRRDNAAKLRQERSKTVYKKTEIRDSDEVRLNKFIANSGLCSRREADKYIQAGVVSVNGNIVTELGTKIKMGDDVRFNGERLTGEKKGELLEVTSSAGFLFGAPCTPGMRVVVMQSVAGDTTIASVYSQDREWVIYLFGILYLVVLVLVGGKQGVKGGIGLVFTFFSILLWYLPMVYRGFSPFWSAVFICIITTLVTMLLIGGFTKKTLVATIGTVGGVLTAGISATLFSLASGITGYNVSDIETLMTLWTVQGIQVGSLLFAGLLISSLGAVMDVAMSIGSSMSEILSQNPSLNRKELWKAGIRVGRDMMGTDSNTLILAFAGGSLSMLLLDYAYDLPYLQIINSNNIGIAIMQGLSGSFGVVLSVPITVAAGAVLYTMKNRRGGTPVKEGRLEEAHVEEAEEEMSGNL